MIAYQVKMKDGSEFTLIAKDVQDARRKAPSVNNNKSYAVRVEPIAKGA